MRVDILNPKALFQKDVRYLIPTFQRPYVWNQEDQWEPLWNDVRNAAERYLDQLDELGSSEHARAEEVAGAHFLGAVVVQQQPTASAEIEARHVIDGQQRLTTLQLLLDAAQEVFERLEWPREAKRLSRLVLNDEDYAEGEPDKRFKIWPTNVDRDSFRAAMTNGAKTEEFDDSLVVQAHEFFQLQIQEWLEEHPEQQQQRVHALETALMGLLEMVVIDLSGSDDAHVIFETLNARGTPLLASDLVKNFVLQRAEESGEDAEALYATRWRALDDKWWRTEVRQGRLVRPRIDVFLNYWLILRTAEEVLAPQVFTAFQRYAREKGQPITEIVQDISEIGQVYRGLDAVDPWSREGTFIYRWRAMDAGVATPVVLWLFSNRNDLDERAFRRSLVALESYLVRRMICRMTTKDYNRLFLDLVAGLRRHGTDRADAFIVDFLGQQTADAREWPADRAIEGAFLNLPLYRLLTRGRLRMVLEVLEDALRSPKAEEQHVPRGKLTIEHVMPQHWHEHWPLPETGPETTAAQATLDRDRLIHTMGNLTLLNRKLNPAVSNSAWATKRKALERHSVLFLNKALVDETADIWNEDKIAQRGMRLAKLAVEVWPSPDALSDTGVAAP